MKIIQGNNLKEITLKFKIIFKPIFEIEIVNYFIERDLFKKKKDTVEAFKSLRALFILLL